MLICLAAHESNAGNLVGVYMPNKPCDQRNGFRMLCGRSLSTRSWDDPNARPTKRMMVHQIGAGSNPAPHERTSLYTVPFVAAFGVSKIQNNDPKAARVWACSSGSSSAPRSSSTIVWPRHKQVRKIRATKPVSRADSLGNL